ncbi:MAG: Xylose import ATP-binding protein XylG [Candidatus Erwinia impunctatus]|nr:Xylose import ATP-binding protein XylG [Culicoides impunctatus]
MPCLLEIRNITKQFGVVKAVDNVSLEIDSGQVLSLCGENGSGKSTLMKVLCGIYPHGSY